MRSRGPELATGEECRALARQVLWFDHRIVPSPLVRVERVLALATLDPRLVDRLGVHPDPADEKLGATLDAWLSTYYRRLPRPPRVGPSLYVLMRRPTIGLARRARAILGPRVALTTGLRVCPDRWRAGPGLYRDVSDRTPGWVFDEIPLSTFMTSLQAVKSL